MRKTTILLSILVLAAMVLSACGGEETNVPATNVPPITMEATETMPATEVPTMEETATGEPEVPVTGEVNPARVSNQLDFPVLNQNGEQIGEVNDMILDLDNSSVAYVIVSTGGFLGIADKEIAVPWNSLQLQTGTTAGTGPGINSGTGTDQAQSTATPGTGTEGTGAGQATSTPGADADQATVVPGTDTGSDTGLTSDQHNVFILQADQATFENAPEFDSNSLPQVGQPAADWDADINSYWQGGGAPADSNTPSADSNTPSPDGTAVPDATSAGTGTDAGQGQATATAVTGTDLGTVTGQAQDLQGVMLASDVLGSTLMLGMQGTGGTGTGQATAEPGLGQATADPNATAVPEATVNSTMPDDQGVENMSATIEDLIVDTEAGDIQYIVINTSLADGERWIPVPVGMFQWDASTNGFILNAGATMLQDAPFFQDGQFPNTSVDGWNSEFETFWQNNGGVGNDDGEGSGGTATP